MSLQRRLMIYLLLCAPLVWLVALAVSVNRARHQVDELYDTELIRLARQVQATLGSGPTAPARLPGLPTEGTVAVGEADVSDLAIAVWDAQGHVLLADREGTQLPRTPDATGFVDMRLGGEEWRVYYLQSRHGDWLVASGQKAYERDELVFSLTASQIAPWLLVLPALLVAMAWAVRRAIAPVHDLTAEIQARDASDLQRIPEGHAPTELKPLVGAMNGLFQRIEETLARERRFTADAAHELRTPLAVLRAQWDVVRRSDPAADRVQAEAKFGQGLDRLDRLVTQMLALARLETPAESGSGLALREPVRWQRVVEQAISDCLPLAERRRIELACEWPADGGAPLPLMGDEHLMTVLLRNLLDNALRYAPEGSPVSLHLEADRVEVTNEGEPLSPERLARLGERFYRPEGQQESGSGLGVSIVRRIAALHGLEVGFAVGDRGRGMRVVLRPATAVAAAQPAVTSP